MIEVTNLTKTYGDKRGVNNISFSIGEGEIVGFLGPNGAGKSTTMNILTGYLSATSGSVKIAGVDVLEDPMEAKRHIGYLPEQPPLYMDMTVKEYLNFIYELKGATAPRKEHLAEICTLVGIEEVYGRVIKHLSKGYKQRVGLAQALVGDPDVLILDEPTVGLDPKQIIEIRNVIKRLGKARTIILSTHILPEVTVVCERVLVINAGQLVADDTPDNLSGTISAERKFSVRIAGHKESVLSVLRAQDGIKYAEALNEAEPGAWDYIVESRPNLDVRKPLFVALARANMPILQLQPLNLSLEDIFLRLTTEESGVSSRKGGKNA